MFTPLQPILVGDGQEAALGEGWTDVYQHKESPKFVFHPEKAPNGKLVNNGHEHQAPGRGLVYDAGGFSSAALGSRTVPSG